MEALATAAGSFALPLAFIENRGQWSSEIKFAAFDGPTVAQFRSDGISLQLAATDPVTIGLTFQGASAATIVGETLQQGYYNFFVGNDPTRWQSRVAAYASVRYDDLYDGVDVRVRENAGRFEYDLLLEPNADLDQVVIRADGVTAIDLHPDGSLQLATSAGVLRQSAPVTWEVLGSGEVRSLASRFRLIDAQHYGFEVPGRDPNASLVVDPGLEWSTFLGGNGDDMFAGIAVSGDGSGDVIVAGQTQSADFPRTRGMLLATDYGSFLSPTWTPFVARMNSTGSSMVYATFFGGSGNHSVRDVAVNAAGEPVLVGDTNSVDFPTTPGAYDRTGGHCCSGDYDAYVIKFTAGGDAVAFGTYLSGSPLAGAEVAWRVAYDNTGSVIVAGSGAPPDFPTTPGAYPGQPGGVFVSRFNPTGTQLTYSALIGPGNVFALAVDPQGFVTLGGQTYSSTFPVTPGAFDTTYNGNASNPDGFVTRLKLDGAGTADLRYSTYLGGAQHRESVNSIAVDPNNSEFVTVAGFTRSGDFPTTAGAFQRVHPIPIDGSVAFITRFHFPAAGLASLRWSTMFGAPGNQAADQVMVDNTGAAIIVGSTAANNPITTERAFDRLPGKTIGLGSYDAFAARISSDGSQVLYSTLLGGYAGDVIQDAVYVGGTSIVIGGLTNSPNFPTTPGAFDRVYAADGQESGGATPGTYAYDVFVGRFDLQPNATADVTPPPAPSLRWPPEGSTVHVPAIAVPFDWTDVTDASGIAAYHLQLSPNPTFTNDIDAELRGWFEPWLPNSAVVWGFSISNTGTWYWRVQALDVAGNLGPWSAVRSLTAVEAPVSPAPSLTNPPNNGRFGPGDVTFAWQAVAGAKYYQLQVDTSSTFTSGNLVTASNLTQSQHKLNLTREAKYWWRVRLTNDTTAGPWSTVRNFEIKRGSPLAPTPPPPAPGNSTAAPFTLSPTEQWANPTGPLTVTLASPAPAGGAVVTLTSVYPDSVIVPATVTVPAGASTATFTATAGPGRGGSGVIAEYAGAQQASHVYVAEADKSSELDTFVLVDSAVIGGTNTTGTVSLVPTLPAGTGGAMVTLLSGDTALAATPFSVTIPPGSTSASFNITTQPVTAPTWVPIFASRSMTRATRLTLLPASPAPLSTLALSPTSVVGGGSVTGTVTLPYAAPTGGLIVKLASSNTAMARVPATIAVPAGASSAQFSVTTSGVATNSTVTVSATLAGTTVSAPLTVTASATPLTAPTLSFPTNGARVSPGQTIAFDWSDVSGAASYTIQIDDSSSFPAPHIVQQSVTASTYVTNTLPTRKMWWRVRAHDVAGNPGAWSAVREIEVKS